MERFYDTDQDQLFNEARVINPFKKGAVIRPKVPKQCLDSNLCPVLSFIHSIKTVYGMTYVLMFQPPKKSSPSGTEECEICFMVLPSSVSS